MSEKKASVESKKNTKETPEKTTKKDSEKTADVTDKKLNSDGSSSPEKVDKAAPKSASQSSISHFSSVATPAYRDGWAAIFGNKGSNKKTGTKNSSISLPVNFTLEDEEVSQEIKKAINTMFQKKLRKQGISLATIRKEGSISYRVECEITKK